jgi:hypothetical protein
MALGVAAFCVVAGVTGVAGAASPPSAPANQGSGSSTAVVTPLLEFFEFGNTVGLPLACADGGSVASIIGAESGTSAAISPLTVQLDKECSELSAMGDGYLQKAIAEASALSLINPAVNPLIAALSNGLTLVGTQYGPALAPFGPTVAGLGGTVAFFEGS